MASHSWNTEGWNCACRTLTGPGRHKAINTPSQLALNNNIIIIINNNLLIYIAQLYMRFYALNMYTRVSKKSKHVKILKLQNPGTYTRLD